MFAVALGPATGPRTKYSLYRSSQLLHWIVWNGLPRQSLQLSLPGPKLHTVFPHRRRDLQYDFGKQLLEPTERVPGKLGVSGLSFKRLHGFDVDTQIQHGIHHPGH